MYLQQVFDPCLAQYAYLIACQATGEAIVFDPERDIDRYLKLCEEKGFRLVAAAETHIHADFLSGARELGHRVGAKLYLSAEGEEAGWGSYWAKSGDYDVQFIRDGDIFKIGNITFTVVKTPGHTPEHVAYLVTDAGAKVPVGMISGDFLFVGDLGRPDLLETAAKVENTMEKGALQLYESASQVICVEDNDHLLVWPAHGAGSSCGKGLGAVPHSSFGYEKRQSPALAKVREGQQAFIEYILQDQPEPPLYFARMKAENRDGVSLLGQFPEPPQVSLQELEVQVQEGRLCPIDTREDRRDFLRCHLPGSLYAPYNSSFCTTVGSLLEDPSTPLLLVVAPEHEDEIVRRLIRIGYDRIEAVVTLDTLSRYFIQGGKSQSISQVDFAQAEGLRQAGSKILDLRYSREHRSGHLPGAVHIPYTRLLEHEKELPKDAPIVAHCHSGLRAAVSAAYLKRQGFDVSVVSDLIDHYSQVGHLEISQQR